MNFDSLIGLISGAVSKSSIIGLLTDAIPPIMAYYKEHRDAAKAAGQNVLSDQDLAALALESSENVVDRGKALLDSHPANPAAGGSTT